MKYLYKISFILMCVLSSVLEAKVNVFAHYFGQPEFVKYQYMFLKKNMLDEYEFVVFEDSFDPIVSEQIRKECKKYDITYVHIPKSVFECSKFLIGNPNIDLYAPSFGCSVATQYIYDNYVVPSKDICLILDNDIFLLSPFSVEKYIGTSAFAYSQELKTDGTHFIYYMLPNFVIFNPRVMPEKKRLDFNLGSISGVNTDSGGCTYHYLRDYAHFGIQLPKYYLFGTPSPLKERFMSLCPLLFTSQEWSSHYFIEKDAFLHIRMGSNWSKHKNYLQIRREIETLFDELLK